MEDAGKRGVVRNCGGPPGGWLGVWVWDWFDWRLDSRNLDDDGVWIVGQLLAHLID